MQKIKMNLVKRRDSNIPLSARGRSKDRSEWEKYKEFVMSMETEIQELKIRLDQMREKTLDLRRYL